MTQDRRPATQQDPEHRGSDPEVAAPADRAPGSVAVSPPSLGSEGETFKPCATVERRSEQSESEECAVGKRIGPYQVIREIGRGGMGQVYQAIRADDEYRKIVAIKVVRLGMDTAFFLRRFRQERQILANLDHPNIARLLDGGTTETGLPYFVIEYIEGQDLIEYCDTRQLSITDRLSLFLDICSAVQHAHRNLIVHRDIKPGNILVTQDGVPKLLDLGIAKVLNPDVSDQTGEATVTGLHLMTPDYASPEQARLESVTTATDVYLLGALLNELLTGHRPHRFKNYQPQEVLHAICEVDPERPSTVVTRIVELPRPAGTAGKTVTPESVSRGREGSVERLKKRLSGDLDTIVLMAMRKEPRLRYQSVQRFADDIRRHLRREPVIARSPTVGYRAGKFVSRNKAKLAALAFMALAVIAGVGATIREAQIARDERLKADRRFNDVRHLANSFLFEFHDAIESLPGSTRARTLVVTKALEYLDLLAAESGDDAGLHRELATAYQKVGDLQGRPDTPNLGGTAGAIKSQQKAQAIRERLVERMQGDAEVLGELATSHDRIGELLLETGNVSAALARFRSTLALREKLVKESPTSKQARSGLSGSHSRIGSALNALGDTKGARERAEHGRQARGWYEKCLEVLIQMRDNKTLSPSQPRAPDEIRGEIAKCDKAVAALHAPTLGALARDSYQHVVSRVDDEMAVQTTKTPRHKAVPRGQRRLLVDSWCLGDLVVLRISAPSGASPSF
ncbi:MAG: protein kinase, partial [Acidobacteria bacterium]|nr:protein kinase [Acidobacteriota bacterium]